MPPLIQLKLYTTSNCHLCDQAIALLSEQKNITLTLIEIAGSNELISIYGTRIPVLQNTDSTHELDWPFGQHDLIDFIKA